jgi:hypothetical protein
MGEGTGELRQEIEQTRARVGEEVEALSYKTDVGARLDDYVDGKKEAVASKVSGVTDAVTSVVPSGSAMKRRARSVGRTMQRNPLGMAIGGAAVGFVAGFLMPSTSIEDEHLGDVSERVKDMASEAGHEAIQRGKDVAESAMETVKEEGAQQGRELASDLSDRVQQEVPEAARAQ